MSRQIFRQAALDRLASPEQLDRPSRLVRPRGWIAFGVLAAAILGASGWAVLSRAPIKVAAAGIVFDTGQLIDVSSATPGRIMRLNVEVGDTVRDNDAVALLARPELELDLDKTRADLADARSRRGELERFYAAGEERERAAEDARLETITETQKQVTRRIALLEEKIAGIQSLLDRKLLVRERLLQAELEMSTARERHSELEDERKLVQLRRLERESKTKLALLDEQLKINELERRMKRLEAQIEQETAVKSTSNGRVAEIKVAPGDVVSGGARLMTLIREAPENGNLTAIIYVSPRDGRRVEKGMKVEIVPTTVRKEEYGYASGIVETVADVAATTEGMRSILKNEQLVAKLSGEGAPIAVEVKLEADAATPSGLKWSSSKGPPQRIAAGTLLDAKVVVDHAPVVNLVAPTLDRLLGSFTGEGS